MKKALIVLLFLAGFAVFPINIFAQSEHMLSVRNTRIIAGDLLVEIFDGKTFATDLENVKVVLNENLDGTYGSFKTWRNPPKDRDGFTGAWLCKEITIYVRTKKIKDFWNDTLTAALKDHYGPRDVVPRIE